MVRAAGPAAELGKFNLTDAYKHVLVHPDYWPLLETHVGDGPNILSDCLSRGWLEQFYASCPYHATPLPSDIGHFVLDFSEEMDP